jgi:hypothetical protein
MWQLRDNEDNSFNTHIMSAATAPGTRLTKRCARLVFTATTNTTWRCLLVIGCSLSLGSGGGKASPVLINKRPESVPLHVNAFCDCPGSASEPSLKSGR